MRVPVSQQFEIIHYYHSGFSVSCRDLLFVFDYWLGEEEELPPEKRITPEKLSAFRKIFVFISHEHVDHFDPVVYTWKDYADVTYIVSSDMPVGTRGKRMAPGDTLELEDNISVTAFDSTDLGVSFLLRIFGTHFFHAGDLNFWHWRDESSVREIEEADQDFRKALRPLSRERIDIAFFPVDPRQGSMFDAGSNYFILSIKPSLLIPMHYFHRSDVAVEYARTAGSRTTEVLAMPGYGDAVLAEMDDDGYLNLSFPSADIPEETEKEASSDLPDDSLDTIGDSPFAESDLPVLQLADQQEPENPDEASDASSGSETALPPENETP